MKKSYIEPELTTIPSGSPRHEEILALLNAEEEKKQSESKIAKYIRR